jgi:hypothetical protein
MTKLTDDQVRALIAEAVERATREGVTKGLATALNLVASLGYGENESVDAGHEEAFRAIEAYKRQWEARAARTTQEPKSPVEGSAKDD